jgi:hypothetical protein
MPICSPRELLKKYEEDRKNIQINISKLESQIFEFEGSYLKETGAYGNAVKVRIYGFIILNDMIPQGWTAKGFEKSEADLNANRKTEVKPEAKDRIFSNSSMTYSNFPKVGN